MLCEKKYLEEIYRFDSSQGTDYLTTQDAWQNHGTKLKKKKTVTPKKKMKKINIGKTKLIDVKSLNFRWLVILQYLKYQYKGYTRQKIRNLG